MNYIYFGTSEFAATILEKLLDANMAPVAVVTQPDRPAGRGKKLQESPVKKIAQNGAIPLLQPKKILDYRLQISDLQSDVCIIAAYGGIIPKTILEIPKHGFVNVHPSLLPKYRGPSPIQTAILNGDTETGVSLILLDEVIDHGPIIAQETASIGYRDTSETLSYKLALQSAIMLQKAIPEWLNESLSPASQDDTKATFTKMITKEDGHIDWKKSAEEIERHVRAMTPWPGSWTVWENAGKKIRLHIKKATVELSPLELEFSHAKRKHYDRTIGRIIGIGENGITVLCGHHHLVIRTLQPEGKKEMTARAFVNGHPKIIGSVLT